MDLKQTLKGSGLRQADVAAQLRVSEGTLSRWLNRRTDVPPHKIRLLAEALGVSVDDIVPLAVEPITADAQASA